MDITSEIIEIFSPTGKLRASINLGNPILAKRSPQTGDLVGLSIDLAKNFAERLGLDIQLVVFNSARESVEAVRREEADIGFFAIDPLRGEGIIFTAPYILIEGAYVVNKQSEINTNKDVDRIGNRIAVGKGSAYDLYLTRKIEHAEILRVPTSPEVVNVFLKRNLEVAAGVKQQLEFDIKKKSNLRLLPESFMFIQQAVGLPAGRGTHAAEVLRQFVEEMKRTDFIAAALRRHKIHGVKVAPANPNF